MTFTTRPIRASNGQGDEDDPDKTQPVKIPVTQS